MTKGQWIEYTGSDEQIANIGTCHGDILGRFKSGHEKLRSSCFADDFDVWLVTGEITHYLICNPHPLRDMIKRQADTGQEVWVKEREMKKTGFPLGYRYYATTTPDWNIPNAEYSFTPFEGIKND